ncbi:MAG: hypothetical protein SGPRY_009462, partial [Prymnesium sp.]
MSASIVWGRGTGDGIGLSGHKNEYRPGVAIGNWVEEQFGREAPPRANSLQVQRSCRNTFMKAQEAAYLAAYVPPEPNKRVEPYMGVPASRLFSHGTNQNARFLASMTSLHFTEPSSREYGAKSHDRVHRSYFWGSKHIDSMVPQNDPNTRQLLTTAKRAQWEVEQAPAVP